MNKQGVIERIIEKTGKSYRETEMTVNALLETVKEVVAEGDTVQMVGFGTFDVRQRTAREGRNPATGEALFIPAMKAPVFKAGKAFKEAVNK